MDTVETTALETDLKVVEQQKYLYDKSAFVVILTMLGIGIVVVMLGLVILLRTIVVPPPTYFAATEGGALIPEKPLDQSSLATNELLNWVTEAMMVSNTFNFINVDRVLGAASTYYTKEGFESYKNALLNAGIPNAVVSNKYVLRGVPTDAPQVLLEKPFAGRYMWKIKIPMQFRYQNVRMDFQNLVNITLIVMRVPTTQSPNGVLILKYDLEPAPRE